MKKAWHIVETPEKVTIYVKDEEEGDETIEISKSDPEFDKKIKELAKEHELLKKHYRIHHKKDIEE
jgi:hypothetical protein